MISIPVYYEIQKVRVKNKTIFLSLNWYRNAHYIEQNKVKKDLEETICNALDSTLYTQYEVLYIYHYKSKTSDLPNVTPLASKWVNDALKLHGNIKDDNVQYLKAEYHLVGEHDKDNPRVDIYIRPTTEEDLEATRSSLIEYFRTAEDT